MSEYRELREKDIEYLKRNNCLDFEKFDLALYYIKLNLVCRLSKFSESLAIYFHAREEILYLFHIAERHGYKAVRVIDYEFTRKDL